MENGPYGPFFVLDACKGHPLNAFNPHSHARPSINTGQPFRGHYNEYIDYPKLR